MEGRRGAWGWEGEGGEKMGRRGERGWEGEERKGGRGKGVVEGRGKKREVKGRQERDNSRGQDNGWLILGPSEPIRNSFHADEA